MTVFLLIAGVLIAWAVVVALVLGLFMINDEVDEE